VQVVYRTAGSVRNPWQVSHNNGSAWTDVTDAAPSRGLTTPRLTLAGATEDANAFQFRAVFTNAAASVRTNAAALTVRR
jgi:hypothetical protein